jgi:hypothetical protein
LPSADIEVQHVVDFLRPNAPISDLKQAASFMGRTVKATGTIGNLSVLSEKIIAILKNDPDYRGPLVQIFFGQDDPSAQNLFVGQNISVIGHIGVINQTAIALLDSVITSPTPPSPR